MDLQISRDGHLIVQHDAYLNETTNISEYSEGDLGGILKDLQREDGKWYIKDFTLAQLKMLKLM